MPTSTSRTTQTIDAPPPDQLELFLQQMAKSAYLAGFHGIENLSNAPGFSVPAGGAALIDEIFGRTVRSAGDALRSSFQETQGAVYDEAASRGALVGSFVPTQLGIAQRGLQANLANVVNSAGATAAGQKLALAESGRQDSLQRLLAQIQGYQWASNPGLLTQMQALRVNLAPRTTVTKEKTPTDWGAIFSSFGESAANAPWYLL